MKPKCPKCGRILRDVPGGVRTEWQRIKGGTTICCPCGWSRHVSRAAIIRLAVAKPETCKWTSYGVPECDSTGEGEMRCCYSCGKPVEVVNG